MKIHTSIKRTIPVIMLLALMASVLSLGSCSDDDDMNSGLVELFSFGPAGVKHGETIKFIGRNLDQVTAIVLPEDLEIDNLQFTTRTSELIELTVPEEAGEGRVILKTPQGDIESKSIISFDVPVEINSFTPIAKPGTNVTITGKFLNWINEVHFYEGVIVSEFVSQSMTELVVTVPMAAQTGRLIFSSGGTNAMMIDSDGELTVTLPAVTAIGPTAIRHTDELTISGTDLDLVIGIVFNAPEPIEVESAFFLSHSETEIKVAVPVGTQNGSLTLQQASPIDIVTEDGLSIILPVGTNVSPVPATPGEDNVTITGTNLDLVGHLNFPGLGAPIPAEDFIVHTATEITLLVPEGTTSGGITYTTIHGYTNNLGMPIVVPGDGPAPLAIVMYDDEVFFGGGDWSWEVAVSDPQSTEQFYSGVVSWKFQTSGEGGVSVGGMSGIDASGRSVFAFSLYGGPGTDGAEVACILGDGGGDVWDDYNTVILNEGEWTEYEIDLENYPSVDFSNVTRWIFKVEGMAGTTIYVDRVGFD